MNDTISWISIITAILTAVAAIWKHFDANYWKNIAIEAFEAVDTIKKSKEESSPGGIELTLEEKAAIGEQSMDVIIPLWDKFEKWIKKRKLENKVG